MAIRTIAPFLAYEADGGGTGVPLLAKGTPGTVLVAAADTTQTGIVATAYRLSDGAEFVPMANQHGAVEGFRVDIPDEAPGIWFVSGPVASYRPTVEGSRGERGLPGPDAIENDETVGEYMATAGTRTRSETKVLVSSEVDSILDDRTKAILTDDQSEAFRSIAQHFTTKGEIVYNVLDFGAAANGVTDDGPAIQAALTAASGKADVLIPPGDYGLGSLLRLPSNVRIIGYGATLHRLPGLGGMIVNYWPDEPNIGAHNGRSNIIIEGLTIDAHGNTIDSSNNVLTFNHARNITCRDMTFRRTNGFHALEFNAVDGGLADNCVFEGFVPNPSFPAKEAIQIDCANPGDSGLTDGTMTKNVTIRKCRFTGYGVLPAHDTAVGSHITSADKKFYTNINVIDCYIQGSAVRAIKAHYWKDSAVSGCTIETSSQGILIERGSSVTVTACTISGATVSTGVSVFDASNNCRVVGNHIYNTAEGIYVGVDSESTVVSANIIERTKSYGVTIDGGLNTLISGNRLRGVGYPNGALGAIRVSNATAPARNTSVSGNKVTLHGAGTEVASGVSVAATATDTWVFGNDFKGLAAATSGTVNTTSNRI